MHQITIISMYSMYRQKLQRSSQIFSAKNFIIQRIYKLLYEIKSHSFSVSITVLPMYSFSHIREHMQSNHQSEAHKNPLNKTTIYVQLVTLWLALQTRAGILPYILAVTSPCTCRFIDMLTRIGAIFGGWIKIFIFFNNT